MIKSVIWSSMLDYPKNICTSIFLDKCNFNCEYCHNKEIKDKKSIDFFQEILPKLHERKIFIKHIILSGGEATINKETQQILNCLYEEGFKIGIHTNGSNPEFIRRNIKKISYIGMDIKNCFSKYSGTINTNVNIRDIEESINLIINSEIDYEFRTTVYPKNIEESDCVEIAKYLNTLNSKVYVLQQYNIVDGLKIEPYSVDEIQSIARKCNKYVNTLIRGI